jgi:hypothetical protein
MRLSMFIAVGALGFAAGAVQAGFVMLVDDPNTAIIELRIEDGGVGDDLADIPGVIGFEGDIGGVHVNATGQSKDVVGSTSSPQLNLDYEGHLSAGNLEGSVDIFLTDTAFQAAHPSGSVSFDGLTGGTLQLGFFGSSSNEEFEPEFVIVRTDGVVTGEFDQSLDVTTESMGSLMIRARIGFDSVTQTGLFAAEVALVAEYVPGDVNGDGEVNGLDVDPFVDILLNGPYQATADMNEDQVVNGLDVDPFVTAVVGSGVVQAVPEPTTLVLTAIGLSGLAMVQRRRARRRP